MRPKHPCPKRLRAFDRAIEPLERRMLLSLAPAGAEFRANSFTTGDQSIPAVAADADGDFVVVWDSAAQDGSDRGIYAQRYNAAGVAQGAEFRVNTFTTGAQRFPAVAMDADGDFVIAWDSVAQDGSGTGIFAQRYNAAGAAQGGEFRVNTFTTGEQFGPAVAMNANGGFVVTWKGNGSDDTYGIYARRYNPLGAAQGGEFLVNTFTTNTQRDARVAMDANGDFVVAWTSSAQDPDGSSGVYAQRYNAAGAAQGEFRVNTITAGNQKLPSVAIDASGDFVVAWTSSYDIFAQRYNAAGVAQGGELRANTVTAGLQDSAAAAMDADGDFIIAWSDGLFGAGQDGSGAGVFAQSFNAAGVPQGGEFRVNTFTTGNQSIPSMAMNADGDAVVAWQSNNQEGVGSGNGVYAQRYAESSADTVPPMVGGVFVSGRQALAHELVPGPVTSLVVSFSDNVSDAGGPTDPNSVTNPANWRVARHNGTGIADLAVTSVNYLFSVPENRFQATLQVSGTLTARTLQIILSDNVRDIAGNRLDGDADGAAGGAAALSFSISFFGPHGPELRANTFTIGAQALPTTAIDAQGNFVVAWASVEQDGDRVGVFAQRYDAVGAPQGGEFRVNTFTTDDQSEPSVAMDADGDFVVAWTSRGQDGANSGIYAQRFSAAGMPQGGEFRVNQVTTDRQAAPAVAMDSAGNFVVAWHSVQDGSDYGIYARRYNAQGVATTTEFQVNQFTTSFQVEPDIAVNDAGDFVVAWISHEQDGDDHGVYARRFSPSGAAQGNEFRVNTFTTGFQESPTVAIDNDGDFVIAWSSFNQDGSGSSVHAQRYSAGGVPQGSEFLVNTTTTSEQIIPSIATDDDGDFVVVWSSLLQDGSDWGNFAQRYRANGAPDGSEFRVNRFTTSGQLFPAVAMDPTGDFVVSWTSYDQDGSESGVFAQRFDAGAVPTVAALSDFPDPVTAGNSTTLTASGETDDEGVVAMWFYRESNGIAGLQFGAGGDAVVGTDTNGGDGWAIAASTVGLAPGTYLYYAQPVDVESLAGAPATTLNTVVSGVAPAVTASQFRFETLPQRLRFTFDQNVSASLGLDDIEVRQQPAGPTITPSGLSYDAATNTATFSFNTPLPDARFRARLIAAGITGPGGTPMAADHLFDFTFLRGDANGDGRVNLSDFNILASNFGQSPRDFTQGDFNYDTIVNLQDFNALASRFGTELPPPGSRQAPVSGGDRAQLLTLRGDILAGRTSLPARFSRQIITELDALLAGAGGTGGGRGGGAPS